MGARRYEIHVRGPVSPQRLQAVLEDFPEIEVSTVLSGRVADQSELLGLLLRLHGLGLVVVAMESSAHEPVPAEHSVPRARPGSP